MDETLKAVYAQRRARLAAQLGPSGVAVIPTAPERGRNRDSDFPYRHDSYFFYLTGFTEPQACLVLTSEGRNALFCLPKDLDREIWDGYRLGHEAAPQALGVDEAFSSADLKSKMPQWLENRSSVWFPFATHEGLATQIEAWLTQVRARVRFGAQCPAQQNDVCALLDEMRLVKDGHELATMRQAARISAGAHVRAMQSSARMLRLGQDVREYHLEAELLHEFRRHGSQFPAYTSIVAAGSNACVLHYRADAAPLRAGQLVLIDAGCELNGYASDITRTFPADGHFTPPQQALYELVLASQEASVQATRPGARFTDPHQAAVRVLAQGLLDEGLLVRDQVGGLDDVIEKRAYFPFYMHRTSHWLGMDVHDCGSYVEPGNSDSGGSRRDPISGELILDRPSRILRPGMVLTLEPGLYVRPASNVPEQFWNIGIRIEDDAVVTESGCELITRDVPVSVRDIEALMRD
ncbi:MAG: aminopeptidase P N-terminal domain-containing protein [Alphaproteobacteria bacterium]|nr:aminopeptidase P N-terminal domain-containing protein [Alphaproteobacteria bacterium]